MIVRWWAVLLIAVVGSIVGLAVASSRDAGFEATVSYSVPESWNPRQAAFDQLAIISQDGELLAAIGPEVSVTGRPIERTWIISVRGDDKASVTEASAVLVSAVSPLTTDDLDVSYLSTSAVLELRSPTAQAAAKGAVAGAISAILVIVALTPPERQGLAA